MDNRIVLFENRIDCCGCWACENICPKGAIKMTAGTGGYLYPVIDENLCVRCGACLKVCPMKKKQKEKQEESKKPHVKIVNYGMYNNFGAVIASACLEQTVRSIVPDDYIVQTLNYDSNSESTNSYTEFKNEIINRIDFLNIILEKMKIKKTETPENEEIVHSGSSTRKHRYNKFRNKFIHLTPKMNNADLDNMNDNDAALICGSDVIWFPPRVYYRSCKGFFLDFGSKEAKRIAYAASIDSKVNSELMKRRFVYKRRFKNFDCISVRETENIQFVQSVSKKNVVQCVDPVFLYKASDFEEMMSESEVSTDNEEYIYAYILMKNDSAYNYALKLAKEKNLKICFFADYYDDFGQNSEDCFSDGPAEFLQRIKNAKYVVTTSFHCIVFSLIFQKQFLAFERGNNSVKIPDILKLFDLHERLVVDDEIPDVDASIDYRKVKKLIEKYRGEAYDFLKDSLNNI